MNNKFKGIDIKKMHILPFRWHDQHQKSWSK